MLSTALTTTATATITTTSNSLTSYSNGDITDHPVPEASDTSTHVSTDATTDPLQ